MLADPLRDNIRQTYIRPNIRQTRIRGSSAAASFLGTRQLAEPRCDGVPHATTLRSPPANQTFEAILRRRRSCPPASMPGDTAG